MTLGLIAYAAAGCASAPTNNDGLSTPAYNPSDFNDGPRHVVERNRKANTSLWADQNMENYLFTDHKAKQVNDIVTINIVESSSAKKKATTKLDRGSSINAGIEGMFGLENQIPRFMPDMNMSTLVGAKTGNKFDGSGETERTEKLMATMTALVTEVLPNGNLVIEGKRQVKVNQEEQIMILSGIIRPRDIAANNTIPSTYIADAKIDYVGKGVISEKQRPGWLTRVMDALWPF